MSYKIQQGFNASAKEYDRFSALHREIADKLLARVLKGIVPSSVLDVGCGTGYLTGKIKEQFPRGYVVGLDFAQRMLEIAAMKHEGIDWVLGSSDRLPFDDGNFDILVSNLAYQWAEDLTKSFSEAWRALAPGGIFAVTLFGHNTCQELFQALEMSRPGALQFTRLPDVSQIKEALLVSGFQNPEWGVESVRVEYKGMQDLIAWLKSIGANNMPRVGYLGKDTMARADAFYRKYFSFGSGVQASFEVISIYVKK